MAIHKLILEDEPEAPYTLLALQSNKEDFKLAFLLNKELNFRFKRQKKDFIPDTNNGGVCFPVYEYSNQLTHQRFFLLPNKIISSQKETSFSEGLFQNNVLLQNQISYLIPQHKQTDYVLKTETPLSSFELTSLIKRIKQIKSIISVYQIEPNKIKNNNLYLL